MKHTRLILIPSNLSEPAPFLVIDGAGIVTARGELTLGGVEALEALHTIAVTPGADVLVRWAVLPPNSDAQARAAATWMLRDEVAGAPDRLWTVLGTPPPQGEPRLVAMVSASLLTAWRGYLAQLGVVANVIIPDVLTLPEPVVEDELIAASFGAEVALRGRRFAATVQPDLVDLVAAGRPVVPLQGRAEIERALIETAQAPVINLLDTGASKRTAIDSWKRAAVLAALVIVSPLVLLLTTATRDSLAAEGARSEALTLIASAAPDLIQDPDPIESLRQRAAAAPPPGGVSAVAAALFTAVEGVEGAELELLIAASSGIKATISYPDYSNIEPINRAMAEAGLLVTETATLADAGRVVSDITIGAAR
jgi:general secretion pathway protein L